MNPDLFCFVSKVSLFTAIQGKLNTPLVTGVCLSTEQGSVHTKGSWYKRIVTAEARQSSSVTRTSCSHEDAVKIPITGQRYCCLSTQ